LPCELRHAREGEIVPSRIVVAIATVPAVADRAAAQFDAVLPRDGNMSIDQMVEAAVGHRAEGVVITSSLPLSAEIMARIPPSVKIVATSSVGYEHIDVAAARARGLIVTNTPGVLTDCTADMALLLILGACRRARDYLHIMEEGWRRKFDQSQMLGINVRGRTLGIVGLGRIGQAVAARARAFGMAIAYTGPRRVAPELEQGAQYFSSLPQMLPHCQILSLHAPAGPQTEAMMNAAMFALLPRGAVFINAARGSLVDEDALIAALASGHLYAAGLDVFRSEPAYDLRLRDFPNVFFTPHMGSATLETRTAMGMRALDNIASVLAGNGPIDPLWR
jgi:lactate dehydrogenase-like 2-hydroxyacid dehydrogenase